jgi:molybdopterin-guanine dinucleotide biosynthesis protein
MKPTFVNSLQPAILTVVIAGTSSNTGKTTLLCDLLRELGSDEKWEAIKLTRGHYRSCGKDPQACCVSPLLGDQPIVRSGRDATYAPGKDTGRYWEAGASDVHWVIATDNQVEQGIRTALARVKSGRVLIEGTSLLKFIEADFVVMVSRIHKEGDGKEGGVEEGRLSWIKIKASARRALAEGVVDAIYISGDHPAEAVKNSLPPEMAGAAPIYTDALLPQLVVRINSRLDNHRSISSIQRTPAAY